nr:hypothetical protein [Tanacetum cinerariifolium]
MDLDLEARIMGETLILNRSFDPLYGDYIKLNDMNVPLELRRNQVVDLGPTIEEDKVFNEPVIETVKPRKFYNLIMKDKIEFKGRNELENFINAPVFIGSFYIITNFTVVEYVDLYLDKGMGDVIVGEPFCKASSVEARRFDGIITISDGDDSTGSYSETFYGPQYVYPGFGIRRTRWKEIDNVGGVYLIWNL